MRTSQLALSRSSRTIRATFDEGYIFSICSRMFQALSEIHPKRSGQPMCSWARGASMDSDTVLGAGFASLSILYHGQIFSFGGASYTRSRAGVLIRGYSSIHACAHSEGVPLTGIPLSGKVQSTQGPLRLFLIRSPTRYSCTTPGGVATNTSLANPSATHALANVTSSIPTPQRSQKSKVIQPSSLYASHSFCGGTTR